jgi:hypothetical protein
VPALAGCCLVLVVLTAETAPRASSRSDRPGVWFLAAGAAALACCVVAALVLRRRPARTAAVLAVAAAIQLLPAVSPLLFSRDAYSYWAYARIAAVHERNPYRAVPAAFPTDPAVRAMAHGWRGTTSVYGPLFSFVSEGTVVAGDSRLAAAKIWQITAAAGIVALAALAAFLSPMPAFAAALVGWNPLFAVHFGGGGHNDAWMMVLLLGALAAERRGRARLAGALWACSVAVKWVPLALLPLRAGAAPRRTLSWPAFAGTAALLAAGAVALYGAGWLHAAVPLVRNAGAGTRTGAPHLLHALGLAPAAATVLTLGGLGAAYALLFRSARRGRPRLGLGAGALLCTTPWLLPWYAIWALPLAAAEDDRTAVAVATALTAYLLLAFRL